MGEPGVSVNAKSMMDLMTDNRVMAYIDPYNKTGRLNDKSKSQIYHLMAKSVSKRWCVDLQ